MQFKNIALAGFISLASAASSDSNVTAIASQLPSCATSCLTTGAASAGCGATDYSCQCDNKATIETNATSCLTTSCSVTDITCKCPLAG
ncbi:hypothetical protein M406DRAFT_264376 [Cryphonectria parasitica EP155]|uniref:CFEM domain-containing protein n=1 Tax=Cryphonectria parasitica (strain ATCC 38755 / EP155) TaxID=660469 RepID=A0A9P4XXW4_CRYP1|nr:uncharacterized protein M406DRAFT_264376 [Cryphonectria parasitica EP155]KAF3762931.1 hypothetical protein M406DRAFT_264376 [Cryphonectria parasitica EP155]